MENILIVEDDNSIVLGLKYSLEQEGFNVGIANTLNEGREKLKEKIYNLVLLDINLPDGNGYEFCKEIRQNSDVGIIFLTACDEEVNVVMGLDIGGDDYITKPFRVRELISRIKAVIRRKTNVSKVDKKVSIFGDLRICSLDGKVYKGDEEVILTLLEYKLLMMFTQNSNIVLTRNQILQKLWDEAGEYVNDNTLSVYIKRLRSKIEEDIGSPKFILTVRGVGYKWAWKENN
ncbi:response regulator transcription factor [Clostridium ihumii]|uniref:response regulator transcription factor n=1 Tax=Clostridium ihumii TaxID=1470356 RepID=UPI00058CC0D7|nr:response regulator transcription factor [Clostridium ihumii]